MLYSVCNYVPSTLILCRLSVNSQHGADPVQMAQLHKNYRVLNLLIEKYHCKPVFIPDIMEVCTYLHMNVVYVCIYIHVYGCPYVCMYNIYFTYICTYICLLWLLHSYTVFMCIAAQGHIQWYSSTFEFVLLYL